MQPSEKEISFYTLLESELSDFRGHQGKKHHLPFVVFCFILGLITLRQNRSSIHRYMVNNFDRLCALTGHQATRCVSYPQLGRILRLLDCPQLNSLSQRFFGTQISQVSALEWIAGDGKDLKGSFDSTATASRGDVLVRFVTHQDAHILGSSFYEGNKESEINVVRNLMIDNDLEQKNITLDALHCNPETTAQIAEKGGHYLVQAKDKHQSILIQDLVSKQRRLPCIFQCQDIDKAHGRIEQRTYQAYHIHGQPFDKRWDKSQLTTCIVVKRRTTVLKTDKTTTETAFYISNVWLKEAPIPPQNTTKKIFDASGVCQAVRTHWTIEADNYRRDVSFGEDACKTPKSKTAKAIATLRSIAIEWLKLKKPKNFRQQAEFYRDKPDVFDQNLKNSKFVT